MLSSVQSLSHVHLFVTQRTAPPPGFPVHYQLPELAQTHVHLVGDAIQPSHTLLSSSPSARALYSQQKQDLELTVAQIMNSLLPNSDLNWTK